MRRLRRFWRNDENLRRSFIARKKTALSARQQVTLGSRVEGNYYEIISGLTEGDQIVIDGGLFVQNFYKTSERYLHEILPPPGHPPRFGVRHQPDRRFVAPAKVPGRPADHTALTGVGCWSLNRLPVDAYPDLSPPMVEIITQWPGQASTRKWNSLKSPSRIEVEMNGLPHLTVMRSISLYGLSDVIISFQNQNGPLLRAPTGVHQRIPLDLCRSSRCPAA